MIEVRDMVRYGIELGLTAICTITFINARSQTANINDMQQEIRTAYVSDLTTTEKDLYNNTNLTGEEVISFIKYKWGEGYDIRLATREQNNATGEYETVYAIGEDYTLSNPRKSYEDYNPDMKIIDQNKGDYLLDETIIAESNSTLKERLKNAGTFRATYVQYKDDNDFLRYEVSFIENKNPAEMSASENSNTEVSAADITEIKKFLVESLDFVNDYSEAGRNYIDDKYSNYSYKDSKLSTLNSWSLDSDEADSKDDDYHLKYSPGSTQEVLSGDKDTVTFTGRLNHSAAVLRSLIKKYTNYIPQDDSESSRLEETIKDLTGGIVLSSGDNIEGSDEGMFAFTSYEGDKKFLAAGNIFEDANESNKTSTGSRIAFKSENLYTVSLINYDICTIQTGAFSTEQGRNVKTLYLTGKTKVLDNAFSEYTEDSAIIKKSSLENIIISQGYGTGNTNVNTKITFYPNSLAGCSDIKVYFKYCQFNESHNQFRYVNFGDYTEANGKKATTAAYYFAENLVNWYKSIGVSEDTAKKVMSAVLYELRTTSTEVPTESLQDILNNLTDAEKELIMINVSDNFIQIKNAFGAKSIYLVKYANYIQNLQAGETFTLTSADIVQGVKFTDMSFVGKTGSNIMPFAARAVPGSETFLLNGASLDAYFRSFEVSKGTGVQTYKLKLPTAYSRAHVCYRTNKGRANVRTVWLKAVPGEENVYTFSINWSSIDDLAGESVGSIFKDKMRFMLGFE